jgi:hypothetical protein
MAQPRNSTEKTSCILCIVGFQAVTKLDPSQQHVGSMGKKMRFFSFDGGRLTQIAL